ncbi:DUF2147 domain-containing protein [Lutimonas zeaxanthinifaciens]|jgi:uncharacterized protein (DUF2147 family)|uniref:DUF2147 domain-containing protein n=1 Tax=Lutimonas zeaxanthinifaciens TaxID=3060215 RepID=UPI00265D0943|nr:DUF2147 domain-containing protein [Lutimonas sp. YSD2104]WKK65756.1 DUF2147 domain-containing protein [Lutimonas sp. YSD2104]
MKNLILIVITLCSFSVFGQTQLNGTWNTGEDNTKIEISESESLITGTIKSSDNPKAQIGKVILRDLKEEGNNWKGKIFAAKKQKWYEAVITPKGNRLEIEISVGFFSKTIEWTKI